MPSNCSLIESLASLPEKDRAAILAELSPRQAEDLLWDWKANARPNQLPPAGEWRNWLLLSGRGFGKTRCGAEYVRAQVESGEWKRIALIGETAADVRDVMVAGESGLLACYPDDKKPKYIPSKRRVEFQNGAIATTYSGQEPDQLRGPQHDGYWADELAKWQYAQEAWDNLQFGLRLGNHPRGVVSTTPKPLAIIRKLLLSDDTVVTRGSTYENASNLPASTLKVFRDKYEGTRLGRQELHAEVLDDFPGALWQRAKIDELRILDKVYLDMLGDMVRIVVAIDPAVTSNEDSDETGIIGCGKNSAKHGYVLADRSCRASPLGWAEAAIKLYRDLHADAIVCEVNNGGDMVESTIRSVDPNVRVIQVRATRGKALRAEPIASLYEQGRCHHVGAFDTLEDQMCAITPDAYGLPGSPDRADAAVWGLTELFEGPSWGIFDLWKQQAEEMKKANNTSQIQNTNPAPGKPAEIGEAQKAQSDSWANVQTPKALGKVATSSATVPVCLNCGNKFLSVFTDSWKCGACGSGGSKDQLS